MAEKRKKLKRIAKVPFGKNQFLSLDKVIPNDWNPNKMGRDTYLKIKLGISELIEEIGEEGVPAIWTRPHPTRPGCVQVIDGEHRWKIMQELKCKGMPCDVADVSDLRAREMTAELNWNRGEPDPEKYPEFLGSFLRDFDDMTVEYMAERLPESHDEIMAILDAIDVTVEDVVVPEDDFLTGAANDASKEDVFMELKFAVSRTQAEVIEREIVRISKGLMGKNLRGRALEYMAVMSSQTPLEEELPPESDPEQVDYDVADDLPPPRRVGTVSLKDLTAKQTAPNRKKRRKKKPRAEAPNL